MKKKLLIFFILLFFLFISAAADTNEKDILVFEYTPKTMIKHMETALENYKIKTIKDFHLMEFISGVDAILTYDITALPLIESGADYYFYPLYRDIIVIGVDKGRTNKSIGSWEDIKLIDEEVSLPEDDFIIKSIW
ncbi:MAG: hypothetical protein M0P77_07135, partial [Firmicutes bacterium]|nr:hypothetical protein [Bacillota bacterium]